MSDLETVLGCLEMLACALVLTVVFLLAMTLLHHEMVDKPDMERRAAEEAERAARKAKSSNDDDEDYGWQNTYGEDTEYGPPHWS